MPVCLPCPPQECFPSWGGFQTKLQLLILPSDFQLSPKAAELLRNVHRPPWFLGVQKKLKVNTYCTSFKFCVRRKSSAVFQQGQLNTHIYHTKSLGQDLSSLCAPGGKHYISTWLLLPIPTVQILCFNSFIPFSFFLCQRKQKLLFRNQAAKEHHSREGKERT